MLPLRTLSNSSTPLYGPGGVAYAGATIVFTLVDIAGRGVDVWEAGGRVVGIVRATTDANGVFSVDLWPNDRGYIATRYACRVIASGVVVADFVAAVPSGSTTLSWLDFKQAGVALSAQEISALATHASNEQVHIPNPAATGALDGQVRAFDSTLGKMVWKTISGGLGGAAVPVYDEGVLATAAAASFNFVGATVQAVAVSGAVTVTVNADAAGAAAAAQLASQPVDADLTAIAALAPANNDGFIFRGVGAWVAKTVAEIKTLLGLGSAAYTASTAYATSTQGANADAHAANTINPHSVTKAQVGLGNVDNISDANKPVSTAQAAADTSTLNSAKSYADGLVVGLVDDRGNFNASVNAYPSSGGSGAAGAILKGDLWTVSVGGTLPTGIVVTAGDLVRALVDAPGIVQANWATTENNIGYVAENQALRDASGGYAGLSGFSIRLKNAAGTVVSLFTSLATAARNWNMPDKDGTVAMTSDVITDHVNLTSTGTNSHAQIDTALTRLVNTSGANTGDQTLASLGASPADAFISIDITTAGGNLSGSTYTLDATQYVKSAFEFTGALTAN
jgi:hypothetical protein